MPALAAALRYPAQRVLLPRTKLAYVHLRNLLTDAKRDRAGRVSGYVAIWLAEELVLLYLTNGELVNATSTQGGVTFTALPIAEALSRVPAEPELGEICFHEADELQLACMHASQMGEGTDIEFPEELDPASPESLFPYLAATTFDGFVQIRVGGQMNYLLFQDGAVMRGFMSDSEGGGLVARVRRLFAEDGGHTLPDVRRWAGPPPLPVQAAPALIQAYRELASSIVARLVSEGGDGAPAVAEAARQALLPAHPALRAFALSTSESRPVRGTAEPADAVTQAVSAWVTEVLWTAASDGPEPETLLRDASRERRHVFQSAGFFDSLPWKVAW